MSLDENMDDASVEFGAEKDSSIISEIMDTLQAAKKTPQKRQSDLSHGGHINLTKFPIDPNAISAVPSKVVLHYKFMPLELSGKTLKIAVNSLNNVTLFDDLRVFLGLEIIPFLARERDIVGAINQYYGIGSDTLEEIFNKDLVTQVKTDTESRSFTEITSSEGEDASVVRFVNKIFFEAYRSKATDIHIEPYEDKLRIRFRVDGELVRLNIPGELIFLKNAIISRIKIMSHLDIAEHRLPQDGRLKVKIDNEFLDMRISTLPTSFGEAINIRLLSSNVDLDLETLGYKKEDVDLICESIFKPHGIVLLTGPTGSGKSSTLYTCLSKLNTDNRKIITIEDPVEYNLEGITQMQTKDKIGFTFARGLRSILRHDPDIVMVGEIRDRETAEIAMRSALTGHLVFSTLHTNTATQTITRLMDLGIESYLLADSLELVIAQRLVRKLCFSCRRSVKVDIEKRAQIKSLYDVEAIPEEIFESNNEGCSDCRGTGFSGRTAIYEILPINDEIRKSIHEEKGADQIRLIADKLGLSTLHKCGVEKVFQGITTLSEVKKITG